MSLLIYTRNADDVFEYVLLTQDNVHDSTIRVPHGDRRKLSTHHMHMLSEDAIVIGVIGAQVSRSRWANSAS